MPKSVERLIFVALAFLAGVSVTGGQSRGLPEGAKPYTPTRLEWIAMEMEAGSRIDLERDEFMMDFVDLADQDAILIYVRYHPDVNREYMNLSIENAKHLIGLKAKQRGWDSWLTVKEDVKMVDRKHTQ